MSITKTDFMTVNSLGIQVESSKFKALKPEQQAELFKAKSVDELSPELKKALSIQVAIKDIEDMADIPDEQESSVSNPIEHKKPATVTKDDNKIPENKPQVEKSWFRKWLDDEDKVSTDGKDDGKISWSEKFKSFGKGLAGIVKGVVKHPIITGVTMVAAGAAVAIAGTAALPVLIAAGAVIGAVQLGYGIYKSNTAKTDGEAKSAWENMGEGTFALVTSALSAGGALKAAQKAGVAGIIISKNPVKNLATCVKITPKATKASTIRVYNKVSQFVKPSVAKNNKAPNIQSNTKLAKVEETSIIEENPTSAVQANSAEIVDTLGIMSELKTKPKFVELVNYLKTDPSLKQLELWSKLPNPKLRKPAAKMLATSIRDACLKFYGLEPVNPNPSARTLADSLPIIFSSKRLGANVAGKFDPQSFCIILPDLEKVADIPTAQLADTIFHEITHMRNMLLMQKGGQIIHSPGFVPGENGLFCAEIRSKFLLEQLKELSPSDARLQKSLLHQQDRVYDTILKTQASMFSSEIATAQSAKAQCYTKLEEFPLTKWGIHRYHYYQSFDEQSAYASGGTLYEALTGTKSKSLPTGLKYTQKIRDILLAKCKELEINIQELDDLTISEDKLNLLMKDFHNFEELIKKAGTQRTTNAILQHYIGTGEDSYIRYLLLPDDSKKLLLSFLNNSLK